MTKPIISIENVGKKYKIGTHEAYSSLRDSISQVFKPGSRPGRKDEFWALKDVSFDVKPGESLGIIGRNGAGKSTLLKILSQITPPTTGNVIMRGRVASLLEVGTGFHPELTGRENIYLNGAILGMSRLEIKKKFDEIVDFAGIEKFLDTPVKRFSSGMYVRLAFAVAAHLEPEILIVDEVLAVGDSEFQKKCLEKMNDVTKNDGRTILFVSHNLLTIQTLCRNTVLLENGKIKKMGQTKGVIDTYLNNHESTQEDVPAESMRLDTQRRVGEVRFTEINVANANGSSVINSNDTLKISLHYGSDTKKPISNARVIVDIVRESTRKIVLRFDTAVASQTLRDTIDSQGQIVCETDAIDLMEGTYVVNLDFLVDGANLDHIEGTNPFTVHTNIESYRYKMYPDNNTGDHLVKYWFKQVR